MDGLVERVGVGESLVGEVMRLEIAPDDFDVVQLRCIFGQPLDGQPMSTRGQCCSREFAGVDWAIVFDQHGRLGGLTRLWTVEPVQLFKMSDEVAAALGLARMHAELVGLVIEQAQYRNLLRLPRRGNAQVRPRLRPGAGEVGCVSASLSSS